VPDSGREPITIARLREIFGLGISAFMFFVIVWWWITRNRSFLAAAVTGLCLLAASILIMPGSIKQMDTSGSPPEIDEFKDWRERIPDTGNVMVVPPPNAASFVWFSLARPSYLTVSQSSGVVFSPVTAAEVRRRSSILAPVAEPDWRILSQRNEDERQAKLHTTVLPLQPKKLTSEALVSICADPKLDFVVAKESVGFDPVRHTHPGKWKDWNLYDCGRVRRGTPST
jgi:hypothetical protein